MSGAGDPPPGSARRVTVVRVPPGGAADDEVVVEEPLEVRIVAERAGRRERHPLAVTMRTPGHDADLAIGFLLAEGVVRSAADVWGVAHCAEEPEGNVIEVTLAPGVAFDAEQLRRNVYTTSSCGLCGRASIERVEIACSRRPLGAGDLRPQVLVGLPATLAAGQSLFARTGGLHAAALFDRDGRLLLAREDIGRHNALDKLLGALLVGGGVPADDRIVLVSGRASYELVQKSVLAGVPVLAAVGAPSSLAIELAADYGVTLIGFLRDGRFNVYCGLERLA